MLIPTSSIFAHVRITDPQKVDMFVDAMEASEQAQINKPSAQSIPVLKDLDEIRKLVAKRQTVK